MTSAAYAAAVNETQSLGSATSTTRTADQTQIAKFWNDGSGTYSPPGQWNSIADQIAVAQGDSLSADARLFAELNVSQADAAIAAWNAKFTSHTCAADHADSQCRRNRQSRNNQDPNWQSLLNTPNFPNTCRAIRRSRRGRYHSR